jgi:hypothetical protein
VSTAAPDRSIASAATDLGLSDTFLWLVAVSDGLWEKS